MARPKSGYKLKDGTAVPGVTSILNRFKESGGLIMWAFQQGKAGKSHLYEETNKAADIGTCAHGMVELSIRGANEQEIEKYAMATLSINDMLDKAYSAFRAYQKWAENFKIKITDQEVPLVSEQYNYGGTPDAVGLIDNQLVLCDWKSSNAIHPDYLFQLAAYGNLWNENFPQRPITGGYHLLRFSKTNADFEHRYFSSLEDEWNGFLLMRKLYDICAQVKKRCG